MPKNVFKNIEHISSKAEYRSYKKVVDEINCAKTAYDEQIIAGIAMHKGRLIEMQTGEGKTIAAVFPAYLNALSGQGCHILTFNDYLAARDAAWMGPIYEILGLTVGFVGVY